MQWSRRAQEARKHPIVWHSAAGVARLYAAERVRAPLACSPFDYRESPLVVVNPVAERTILAQKVAHLASGKCRWRHRE